jgi:TRAP-type C4-dicarboxylate transport system permease small subunit
VTDEADDEGKGLPRAVAVVDGKLPALDSGEPPVRGSALELQGPLTYPDDGPFATRVRSFDTYLAKAEQVVLVAILAAVVLMGAGHALLEKLAHYHVPYKDDVMRAGTFAIAMLGGAFATHQLKHLSMDLVSRRFSARNRLVLRVVLTLFMIGVLILAIRAGLHYIDQEKTVPKQPGKLLSTVQVGWIFPIATSLIIVHALVSIVLDVDYLRRGKLPPERMRSGH